MISFLFYAIYFLFRMTDNKKYDGSYNPFDDPDEVVAESPQEYTGLPLSQSTCKNKTTKKNNDINKTNNYSNQTTTNNSSQNSKITNNSSSKNQEEKQSFTQKANKGTNDVLSVASEKVGKPISNFTSKLNKKITGWLNI